jgi:hypothetical protein
MILIIETDLTHTENENSNLHFLLHHQSFIITCSTEYSLDFRR